MAKGKEVPINMAQETHPGVYANNMLVAHNKEEFVMDFIFMDPQVGSVVSRVIANPGHMKRIVSALSDNLNKYEMKYGEVEVTQAPKGKIIGLKPPDDNG